MRDYREIAADALDRRPFSNSTEWEVFSARFCWRDCVKDRNEDCPLIQLALLEKTPREWTVEDGAVTGCSEFEQGEPDLMRPTGLPAMGDRRSDGEFEGQTDIWDALGAVSPGGLLSTGSVQTAVSGTQIPPEAPEALRDMLGEFRRLLASPEIVDPNRPVKLVCGTGFLPWLTDMTAHADVAIAGMTLESLYGLPVEVDTDASPLGWRLVNAYGIPIRGGQLNGA